MTPIYNALFGQQTSDTPSVCADWFVLIFQPTFMIRLATIKSTCSISRKPMLKFIDIMCSVYYFSCINHDKTFVYVFIPGPIIADVSTSHFHIRPAFLRTFFPAFHIVDSLKPIRWANKIKLKSLTRTLQLGTIGESGVKSAIPVS